MNISNLAEFIATRRTSADLGKEPNMSPEWFLDHDGNERAAAGLVYDGDAYIEGDAAEGYTLTIYNESFHLPADRLPELEIRLYQWAVDECGERETEDAETATLAVKFADLLPQYMGAQQFAQMRALNAAEQNPNVCHSHDFCDANEVMAIAFALMFDRDPALMDDVDDDAARSGDPDELAAQRAAEDDAELMAAAWNFARPLLGH